MKIYGGLYWYNGHIKFRENRSTCIKVERGDTHGQKFSDTPAFFSEEMGVGWKQGERQDSVFWYYNTVQSVGGQPTFALVATCFTLVSCLAYSSTLKVEATCSFETSVDFQKTTRPYIPEDGTIHNQRCENLKSYKNKERKKTRKMWNISENVFHFFACFSSSSQFYDEEDEPAVIDAY
jgi:hypothetical protein